MTEPTCEAAAFLRPGGPVQVPFRPCCAVVLLEAGKAPPAESGPACPRNPRFAPEPVAAVLAGEAHP